MKIHEAMPRCKQKPRTWKYQYLPFGGSLQNVCNWLPGTVRSCKSVGLWQFLKAVLGIDMKAEGVLHTLLAAPDLTCRMRVELETLRPVGVRV